MKRIAPAPLPAAPRRRSVPPKLMPAASLKILVVDDEEPIRLILEAILVLTGHRVGLASDGPTALAKFQNERWDVVLTDRHMPVMDGEQLARLLKACSPETPVIMVTGQDLPTGCAAIDATVSKPFTLDSIVEAIRRCLAKRAEGATPPKQGIAAAA